MCIRCPHPLPSLPPHQVISEELGHKVENVDVHSLGQVLWGRWAGAGGSCATAARVGMAGPGRGNAAVAP